MNNDQNSVDQTQIRKLLIKKLLTAASIGALVIAGVIFVFVSFTQRDVDTLVPQNQIKDARLKKFTSDAEFKAYLQKGQTESQMFTDTRAGNLALESAPTSVMLDKANAGGSAQRVSETDVQVKGIDEPDIVKTDGKRIFISELFPQYSPLIRNQGISLDLAPDRIYPVDFPNSQTQIVNGFPIESLAKQGNINEGGELLLIDNKLIVIGNTAVIGFDVSDSQNPKEIWKLNYDNNILSTARIKDGQLYIVMQNSINVGSPCPMPLFKSQTTAITVPCVDIYHPGTTIPADSTYTVSKINPTDGTVTQKTSFVGTSGSTVVYMSPQSLYISYTYPGDFLAFFRNFIEQKANDLLPTELSVKLAKLNSYDISNQAKLTEFQLLLEQHKASLSQDERVRIENELNNRMQEYMKQHARDLETTGIAKVNLDNLTVGATGAIPGRPLNQFSLDEHNNHLRIATTTGGNFWWFGFGGNSESTNDLYVLDSSLSLSGKVLDLGVGERIYSARFIGDKGYLVTFKQIDPFFVFDLSNPQNPRKTGELKIPGFSSYLHPLSDTIILGVGQENGQVKLSLFDVSDASNPIEISKYQLDEYYTEVSQNHHAFLADEKYQVFFLPGGKGGYIFSYSGNQLKLNKAVSGYNTKRALYLNDYLYIIATDRVVVLDENTWQEIKTLSL